MRTMWEYAEVRTGPAGARVTHYSPVASDRPRVGGTMPDTIQALLQVGWEPCGIAQTLNGEGLVRALRRELT